MASPVLLRRLVFTVSFACIFLALRRYFQGSSEPKLDDLNLHRRNIGGPCNLDAGGNDPKAVVEIYRTCRDELKNFIIHGSPIPAAFEETMEGRAMVERTRRLVNAKTKCETRKVAAMPMIDSWIRVSKPHNLAYCQLEKTGSSTMLTFLCEINNMETMYPRNDDLHHTSLDHFKVVGEEAVELANRYLDVVQVRHPFTRSRGT
ncbi:Sulfotransferase [Trinorchestia longiramus]|nr:Sulfotransferase [Trinorchestia longiramus]